MLIKAIGQPLQLWLLSETSTWRSNTESAGTHISLGIGVGMFSSASCISQSLLQKDRAVHPPTSFVHVCDRRRYGYVQDNSGTMEVLLIVLLSLAKYCTRPRA
jgi:hypothetical protein